ncbi:hypothetical protein KBI23_17535 [bacterium]|nr:hypothetical protein [bacterium]MBP9810157.1 hypothetical protein [bacterium]
MVSTLPRRVYEEQPVSFAYGKSHNEPAARVSVARVALVENMQPATTYPVAFGYNQNQSAPSVVRATPAPARTARPHLVPIEAPKRKTRKAPFLVRVNRTLQASLIALCGLAILGYGFDVSSSSEVGKVQDQVRRLSEQNSEQSYDLLKRVSYQDIQASVTGSTGLRVPEEVKIVKEVTPPKLNPFKPAKHQLPLMPGY